VRIAGHRLDPLDEFAFDVELEQGWNGPRVRRRIVKGPFDRAH